MPDSLVFSSNERETIMKICKFTVLLLSVILSISLFTGCATEQKEETEEPEINENVVVMTEHFIVSQSMMEYFFNSYYRTFVNNYGDQLELDTGRSLKEQEYSEGQSWFDYLIAQTLRQVQQLLYLNEEALKEELELSEEYQQELEETIARYDTAASNSGTSTAFYIKSLFGESVNATTVRKCLQMQMLAAQYTDRLEEKQAYTDADLEAYFAEHSTEYMMLDLIYAVVPEERAQIFADAENEDVFISLLEEFFLEESPDLAEEELTAKVESAYMRRGGYIEELDFSEWAFDAQRKAYDTYMEPSGEEGKTVVYMLLPASYEPVGEVLYRDNTPVKNLKYILFEAGEDVTADAVQQKAEEVLGQWEEEKGTDPEAAFDALMEEYGGSTSMNLERGRLVAELEEWIFSDSRKEEDTAVIQVEEGTYLLYMLGDGDLQWKVHVREDMLQEVLDETLQAAADTYDARYSKEALYDIAQVYM